MSLMRFNAIRVSTAAIIRLPGLVAVDTDQLGTFFTGYKLFDAIS